MALQKLPIIGPWKAKLTRIYRLALVDCVPNAVAIVYGSFVAAFHVVWSILGPDCVDAAWDRVKRRPGGHRRFVMRGFGIGPMIGHSGGALVTAAIRVGDIAQRIGYYFALIDGLIKGVMYGVSMVYRYSGCKNVGVPFAQFNNNGSIIAAIGPLPTPSTISWQFEAANDIVWGPTGVAFTLSKRDFVTVVLIMSQRTNAAPPLPDAWYTAEVYDEAIGKVLPPSWTPFVNPLEPSKTLYSQDFAMNAGYHELVVKITKGEGVLQMDTASFTITVGKLHDPITTWKCGKALDLPVIGPGPAP